MQMILLKSHLTYTVFTFDILSKHILIKEKNKISCSSLSYVSDFVIINVIYLYFFLEVDEVGTGATDELEEEPSASQMAGKSPNFCVLLHGSLKVEGMVALVQLGWDATCNRTVYI